MKLSNKKLQLIQDESLDIRIELSEAEKKSIKLGLSDADEGRLNPNSEAKKIYGKWL